MADLTLNTSDATPIKEDELLLEKINEARRKGDKVAELVLPNITGEELKQRQKVPYSELRKMDQKWYADFYRRWKLWHPSITIKSVYLPFCRGCGEVMNGCDCSDSAGFRATW